MGKSDNSRRKLTPDPERFLQSSEGVKVYDDASQQWLTAQEWQTKQDSGK